MKKQILGFSLVLMCCFALLSGCSGESKKADETPSEKVIEQFQCPMKCTEELFNKPGKCPVCEMDLVKITKS